VVKHDKLIPLITASVQSGKDMVSPIQKHLAAYVAKNTFDYFIHKDLGGFLNRELDFWTGCRKNFLGKYAITKLRYRNG
jgi:adenine-specific DNA-methyltransferase